MSGMLQADGESQQPTMSGCEAEERDANDTVRLKLEGYFFILLLLVYELAWSLGMRWK